MSTIELSIAETNRLRRQLGLALIPELSSAGINTSETNTSEINAGTNDSETNRTETSAGTNKSSIKPSKTTQESKGSVSINNDKGSVSENYDKGSGFENYDRGSVSGRHKPLITYDEYDTSSWLDSLGKSQDSKKEEIKMEKKRSDDASLVLQHSSEELASLKGGEILHLQDTGVIEDEDDVLINEALVKAKKAVVDARERKKEESMKFGKKMESEDEPVAFEGKTIKIGEEIGEEQENSEEKGQEENKTRLDADSLLDIFEERPTLTFKKPKKMKSQAKKRKREPELVVHDAMVTTDLEVQDEVEDELEKALSSSLAKKQATRKVKTAEDVANEVRMHQRIDLFADSEIGMVYDNTRDFLDSLDQSNGPSKAESKSDSSKFEAEPKSEPSEVEPKPAVLSSEPEVESKPEDTKSAGQVQEPAFSLSSTLKQLRQNKEPEDQKKQKLLREKRKEAELARINIKIEERLLSEELAKDKEYMRMTQDEKDRVFDRELNARLVDKGIVQNISRSHKYSHYGVDRLHDYDPQVNIKYQDSKGHTLTVKEAWKELSHKYHGSAPKTKKK